MIKIPRIILPLIVGLLMISGIFMLTHFILGYSENAHAASLSGESSKAATHPNILLIGSDGLNATNMSLHGGY